MILLAVSRALESDSDLDSKSKWSRSGPHVFAGVGLYPVAGLLKTLGLGLDFYADSLKIPDLDWTLSPDFYNLTGAGLTS
jgi:hypothetical protein